jgi:hypothetical protein
VDIVRAKLLVAAALVFLVQAVMLTGCDQEQPAQVAPPSPIDQKIDTYEKATNEYVRLAKKLQAGDVSIAVKYMDAEAEAKKQSAELQQEKPKMTPQQVERVASISARAAPYLKP